METHEHSKAALSDGLNDRGSNFNVEKSGVGRNAPGERPRRLELSFGRASPTHSLPVVKERSFHVDLLYRPCVMLRFLLKTPSAVLRQRLEENAATLAPRDHLGVGEAQFLDRFSACLP